MNRAAATLLLLGMLAGFSPVASQEPPVMARGALPASDELLRSLPQAPTFRAYLPESVDLSRHFPAPGNQGDQGSCTAWAVGYAARAYYAGRTEGRRLNSPANIPSPGFIYNSILRQPQDCGYGSYIVDGLNLLRRGSLSMADFPYDPTYCGAPSASRRAEASDFRIDGFEVLPPDDLDQIKGALANGNPVIFGAEVDDGLFALWNQPDGIWRAPPRGAPEDGHAMTLVGYDDRRQVFTFINSWGPEWSDGGYGRMDYQTFVNRTREAYVMSVPDDLGPPEPEPDPDPDPAPEPEPRPDPIDPAPIDEVVDLPEGVCGKVVVRLRDGRRIAEGFVGNEEELATVSVALEGRVEVLDVALRPWPQCEALLTLDAQLAESDRPRISVANTTLNAGDTLAIAVTTPDFDGYLHAAYVQADGSVVHLHQVGPDTLQTLAPGSALTFGDGEEGRPRFRVSAPFGDEMLLVLASRSPLFTAPRPQLETERAFLSALRQAILLRPQSGPDRFVSAAYLPLRTVGATPNDDEKDQPCRTAEALAAPAC